MNALGLIGAGVMGRALAQNLADRGVAVVVFDRDAAARSRAAEDARLAVAADLEGFLARLPTPRTVLIGSPPPLAVSLARSRRASTRTMGSIRGS